MKRAVRENGLLPSFVGVFLVTVVGTTAVFTIYLRPRGSPESKPVGASHDETGSSGGDLTGRASFGRPQPG